MTSTGYSGLVEEKVEGINEFYQKVNQLINEDSNRRIFVLFTGNPIGNMTSWCPDCRDLEERLPKVIPIIKPTGTLIRVLVGIREDWKTPKNPFRLDPKLKLTSIPTLVEWKTVKRLADEDIENIENLKLLFDED